MKKLVSILIFAFAYFISSVSCQSACRVDGATQIGPFPTFQIVVGANDDIREDAATGLEIWKGGLSSRMNFESSSHPNVLEFSSNTNDFVITTGLEFKDIADRERDPVLAVTVEFTCVEDSQRLQFIVNVPVIPVNSQPPVFSKTELNYAITTPWNPNVPLNYKEIVTVTDADYEIGNEFTLAIDNPDFRCEFNSSTSELTLFSKISRFPTDAIPFVVTADDGDFQAVLHVNIIVTNKENLLPPKFTENYYYVDEIDPSAENLFIVEIEATDPDNPDKSDAIEYSVPVAYQAYIILLGVNGNRVYFRNSIPPDFPFIFEITATETVGTNPLSTNVAVIVNYPDEQVVFREAMYTFKDIGISLKQNDRIGDDPINILPGFLITLESQYFDITDDYRIIVKQDLEEEDIFTDDNPNGVHVGILKSGSQQAVLLVYFDPTQRAGGTTPGCATTLDAGDCECTTTTAVTDPCPSTAVTCECENECTTPSTEPCPSTAGPCECDNECTTIVTNQSDCSSTPSTFETCPSPTPCDCNNSTTTIDTTPTCPTTIPCDNDCTTPPPDAECPPPGSCDGCDSGGSQTGLVVGIAVVSVIAAGAIGAAVYFYMRSARLSRDTTSSYYNNNTTTDDFGQDTAQKAVSGFNNPIFANTTSFGKSSDKIPLVKETKYDDVLDKVKVVPTSSNAVGSSLNYPTPSTASFSNTNSSSNNDNVEKSSPSEYGSNKDALKSSLAQPKEIPADYDGADDIKPDTANAPKEKKKILFVGEQVIPIEKGGDESNTVKDDLEPPPMSDSEMEDNVDEKL